MNVRAEARIRLPNIRVISNRHVYLYKSRRGGKWKNKEKWINKIRKLMRERKVPGTGTRINLVHLKLTSRQTIFRISDKIFRIFTNSDRRDKHEIF